MDANIEERMRAKMIPERVLRALGAGGYPVDDDPETGTSEIEVNIEDCLWLARNFEGPEPLASAIRRAANSASHEEQRFAARLFMPQVLLSENMKGHVRLSGSPASLDRHEFKENVKRESENLVAQGWDPRTAETEVLWRMAESELGIYRPANKWVGVNRARQEKLRKRQRALYMKIYRNSP